MTMSWQRCSRRLGMSVPAKSLARVADSGSALCPPAPSCLTELPVTARRTISEAAVRILLDANFFIQSIYDQTSGIVSLTCKYLNLAEDFFPLT